MARSDYSRKNLTDANFAGQDLAGALFRGAILINADFSNANLRSVDFTDADLRHACFSGATLGRSWIFMFLHAMAAGIVLAMAAYFATSSFGFAAQSLDDKPSQLRLMLWTSLASAILQIAVVLVIGVNSKLFTAALVMVLSVAVELIAILVFFGVGGYSVVLSVGIARALFLATGLVGVSTVFGGGAFVGSTAAKSVANSILAGTAAVTGALAGAFYSSWRVRDVASAGLIFAAAVALTLIVTQIVAFHRIELRHDGFELLARIWARIGAWGGTRFYGADCSDANFRGSSLSQANFAGANLTRVSWRQSSGFCKANFDDPALANRATEDLVVNGYGAHKSFVRVDLHGLNLTGSDLRHADLTGAICTGTDFTGSTFTGACLENWNIDTNTLLQHIECEYVYGLQSPVNGDRKRRPPEPERCFDPGEFEQLYCQMTQDIEMLLNKGLSKEEIGRALQEFKERQPDVHIMKWEERKSAYLVGMELPVSITAREAEHDMRDVWLTITRLKTENQMLLEYNKDLKEIALSNRAAILDIRGIEIMIDNKFNGPVGNVAQHSQHITQTANVSVPLQNLTKFVTEFSDHLDELKLDEHQKKRAEAQIATLKTEASGEPDSEIVKQSGQTLRNITEGAIGSLLATGVVQPSVWQWIYHILQNF